MQASTLEQNKANVEICISLLVLSKVFPVLFGLYFLLYLPPAHPTSCRFLCMIIPVQPHSNKDLSTCRNMIVLVAHVVYLPNYLNASRNSVI